MAWVRKLDSGLWAATVRTPAGRITETRPLKGQAKEWAAGVEDEVRRGDFIDPRTARVTVGEWRERVDERVHEVAVVLPPPHEHHVDNVVVVLVD